MENTFSVTVREYQEDDLQEPVDEYTDLDGVSEEEARTRAEDLMHAVREEGISGSLYRIDVHDVDEDGRYVYETLWARKIEG